MLKIDLMGIQDILPFFELMYISNIWGYGAILGESWFLDL
jgi:hypothetical protein